MSACLVKTCIKCNTEKPFSEFSPHKSTSGQLRHDCKSCVKEYQRAYYEKHRDSLRAKQKTYKDENRDFISSSGAEYYQKNRESIIAKVDRYRHENYEAVLQVLRNRRARKKNAAGSHTKKDIEVLLFLQKGRCAACTKKLRISGKGKYHIDHIISLARGGSNDKYNLQILCPSCNLTKHAKDPIDWAQKNGRLL